MANAAHDRVLEGEPMTLKLSMTCGPYDRAQALIDGSIKPDGIELDITLNHDDVDRQQRSVRGEFDIRRSASDA